jgi:hypothetical protein
MGSNPLKRHNGWADAPHGPEGDPNNFSASLFNQGDIKLQAWAMPEDFSSTDRYGKFQAIQQRSYKDHNALFNDLKSLDLLDNEQIQYFKDQIGESNGDVKKQVDISQLLYKAVTGNDKLDNQQGTLLGLKRVKDIKDKIADQPGLRAQTMMTRALSVPGKKDEAPID